MTRGLFDVTALRQHAARATRLSAGRPGFDFLLAQTQADCVARLAAVSRPFPIAVDLFSPGSGAAPALEAAGRTVRRLRLPWQDGAADIRAGFDALPLREASLDLAVSLLVLQWCEDLPGLLAQARRALAQDGLFLACLVGGRTLHELRSVFAQAEAETTGGASPRVIPFADVRDAGALLQRAGFALPVADVETLTVRYASFFDLAADLRAMGATNVLRERARKFLRRATLFRAAALYAERFADADGKVRATFDIVWLSGWAPHESQQKPLAPGSAKVSLADVLGVRKPHGGSRQND